MLRLIVRVLRKTARLVDDAILFIEDKFSDYPDIIGGERWAQLHREQEPEPLPTIEKARCRECNGRMSHPHFSCEDFPQVFCMWYCAGKYSQRTGCGIYTFERGEVKIVAEGTGGTMLVDPETKRPKNHPIAPMKRHDDQAT